VFTSDWNNELQQDQTTSVIVIYDAFCVLEYSHIVVITFQNEELKHVNSNQCLGKSASHDRDAPSIGKLSV